MKNIFKILIISFIFFCFVSSKALALNEISKELNLRENFSHLLAFDEKILRYRIGDEEAYDVEIIPDIYNSRHEILIKPLKKKKTNILIWTESYIYNFDLVFKKEKASKRLFAFSKSIKNLSEEAKTILGDDELDKPPLVPAGNYGNYGFEIDLPPGAEKLFR